MNEWLHLNQITKRNEVKRATTNDSTDSQRFQANLVRIDGISLNKTAVTQKLVVGDNLNGLEQAEIFRQCYVFRADSGRSTGSFV